MPNTKSRGVPSITIPAAIKTGQRLANLWCVRRASPTTAAAPIGVPQLRIAPSGSVMELPHISATAPGRAASDAIWCSSQPNQADAAVKPPTAIQQIVFHWVACSLVIESGAALVRWGYSWEGAGADDELFLLILNSPSTYNHNLRVARRTPKNRRSLPLHSNKFLCYPHGHPQSSSH